MFAMEIWRRVIAVQPQYIFIFIRIIIKAKANEFKQQSMMYLQYNVLRCCHGSKMGI